ncbi:MAG TPA: transglycosylase SLT domain-containing protein [Gemmatimonadaceae bacterium]|nr:transglycosylase SLT domain-containing protein [Gemmatimonadaceae bacterium]
MRITLTIILLALGVRARAQEVRFHADSASRVARVARDSVRNANGSPRVWSAANWDFLMARVVPLAERWGRDARLGIAPGYLVALLVKESAGDSLAVSPVPALGLGQLTARTDADLRLMVTEWHFQWMAPEVNGWPRDARVHEGASAAAIDSMLRAGALTARTEYLFDPERAARAAAFWVRLLENKWTTDFWPGGYGPFARAAINGGRPLTESQLLDLVTVCYNRGYIRVHDLVARHGAAWADHLDELGADGAEARDYLERVRAYTALFEGVR